MRVVIAFLVVSTANAWSPPLPKSQTWKAVPDSLLWRSQEEDNDKAAAAVRGDSATTKMSNFAWRLPPTLGDEDDDGESLTNQSNDEHLQPFHNANSAGRPSPFPPRSRSDSAEDVQVSYTDAGTLQMNFPAPGLSANALVAGGFSVAWFSALVPATTMAAAPFLLPFYLAGGLVAKDALVNPFTSLSLSIGTYGWSLDISRYGRPAKTVASGATSEVDEAVVVEKSSVNDKTRQVSYRYQLQLTPLSNSNKKPVTIGGPYSDPDQAQYLAQVINQQLDKIRSEMKQKDDSDGYYLFSWDKQR